MKRGPFGANKNFRKSLTKPKQAGNGISRRHTYLRLKTSKRTSKCQVFSFTVPEKPKRLDRIGALKGGTLSHFSTSIVAKHLTIEGGPFGETFFPKKSLTMPTKTETGTLVSPGIVCYAEKKEKPFWLSSLGQMIQFDTIKFRRTFKNYFGQFVWIVKKSHH